MHISRFPIRFMHFEFTLEILHIDDNYLFTTEDYRLRPDDDRTRTQPDIRGRLATFVV